MRAREMMKRLDRLPKRKGGLQKVPDLSLLSPEKQDRVDELFKVLLDSKDISSKTFDTAFAEFDRLVLDLPLLGPNDPEQGPSLEVPGSWLVIGNGGGSILLRVGAPMIFASGARSKHFALWSCASNMVSNAGSTLQ